VWSYARTVAATRANPVVEKRIIRPVRAIITTTIPNADLKEIFGMALRYAVPTRSAHTSKMALAWGTPVATHRFSRHDDLVTLSRRQQRKSLT